MVSEFERRRQARVAVDGAVDKPCALQLPENAGEDFVGGATNPVSQEVAPDWPGAERVEGFEHPAATQEYDDLAHFLGGPRGLRTSPSCDTAAARMGGGDLAIHVSSH